MANKIYVGDIKVVFRVSTGLDLTTATKRTLNVRQPSGAAVSWTATTYGDAEDGVLTYTSGAGDFPAAGVYALQAYVELGVAGADGKFYGETVNFVVYEAYK